MAYTALYRKFRPLTFTEMVGQEHITRTLRNQIISGRVGHAYLLSGGRGTGKTSSAKILARAINCLNPQDGEPCNECEICKGILSGSLTDVIEMDAASNNSVEDIRSIREEVNFLPTLAKYRVYIIDEVHMLSTGAFNALLKTLEEPPSHVKFILATTEPQKLPATILSRCQRFDFKRLSNQDIIKRLKIICEQSNIEITEGALNIISVLADGALRDGISILERCIQDGETKIAEDKIKELAGIPKLEYIQQITKAIIQSDVDLAIGVIDNILNEGKDLNNFLWEIIKYIKDILVLKVSNKIELYNEQEKENMKQLAQGISKDKLLSLIYSLSELENTMKWSSQKTIMFQVGIIKACTNQTNNELPENLEERIRLIESKLNNIGTNRVPETKTAVKETTKVQQPKEETKKTVQNVVTGQAVPYWQNVVNSLKENGKVMLYTNLINSTAMQMNDMTVGIKFASGLTSFGKSVLEKPENMQELVKLVSMEAGKEMRIKYIEESATVQIKEDNKFSGLDIPINIIEE